ncbi:hypothetical protein GGI12_003918 [Dipsacomyces acuminosporus]|nr:hypothetical protein GGI12_003918 [Dipsacomyces acuminosporus]
MGKPTETTPRNSLAVDGSENAIKAQTSVVDCAEDVHVDGDQSKFSAMLGILRKLVGVTDVISLRLSLPSQLLDPIPNLEYWNYMERPDYFVAIPESDDEVERMLATLAWWFSKLLKHADKVVKPFNSILGEQFFCHWMVDASDGSTHEPATSSSATAVSVGSDDTGTRKLRVEYITEQVSHHPPVSAFIYRCKERGIEAAGMDHISARFTGLSATVAPGSQCKGIFVTLEQRDSEMYECSHPTGNIVGWLRGSLKVQLVENCHILCPNNGLAAVIEFKEERWFGKNKDNVCGKVFRYDPKKQGEQVKTWKLKDIPKSCEVVATFGGNWDKQVRVQRTDASKGSERVLIDLEPLSILGKEVKPVSEQGEMESRRVWDPVASEMLKKNFGEATKRKRAIEDKQRKVAAERKERNEEFVPAIFKPEFASGKPELLPEAPINL